MVDTAIDPNKLFQAHDLWDNGGDANGKSKALLVSARDRHPAEQDAAMLGYDGFECVDEPCIGRFSEVRSMSALINLQSIGPDHTIQYGFYRNDPGLQNGAEGYKEDFDPSEPYADGGREIDILWPRSNMFGAANIAQGFAGINDMDCMSQRWEWNWPATGTHRRKQVVGQIVDQNGNPVSGATVYLFNTATAQIVDTQTSNSSGNYVCGDPNATTNFAVGFKAGSPDTTGATDDNVSGT